MGFNKEFRNLTFDLSKREDIYNEDGAPVSKTEANEAVRKVVFETLGLNEKSTLKQINRALDSEAGKQFFEVIEEEADILINAGWKDNEFFNQFVDSRNESDGDRTDFWTEDEVLLTVTKVSGDHHYTSVQRLGAGSPITVPKAVYRAKIGGDIRLFLTGRKNWDELIEAVAAAFVRKIQDELYAEFLGAASKLALPANFVKNGALSTSTKDTFDQVIADVADVNNVSDVIIMGTKSALKKLSALTDINWIANSQKEDIAANGILGSYEGTTLLELPNRFKDKTLSATNRLVDPKKLWIFPVIDYKPIKMVDGGENEFEIKEIGETMDDQQTYEVTRRMGIATVITRYFGEWTLP